MRVDWVGGGWERKVANVHMSAAHFFPNPTPSRSRCVNFSSSLPFAQPAQWIWCIMKYEMCCCCYGVTLYKKFILHSLLPFCYVKVSHTHTWETKKLNSLPVSFVVVVVVVRSKIMFHLSRVSFAYYSNGNGSTRRWRRRGEMTHSELEIN
jgi:hypothetical protein